MKRTKVITGILTALALIAGSVLAVNTASAGPGCSASKTATTTAAKTAVKPAETVQTATVEKATTAEVKEAKVTTVGAKACCASGAKVKHASTKVGASCDLKTGKGCDASFKNTGYARADGKDGLLDAETVMAKFAHCGIDLRNADADYMAASLVKADCGEYNHQQWATMIKSAQALDTDASEAIFASAGRDKDDCCTADACPMTLVAKDLADFEARKSNN